jgi:molybdate transport system regulatory protein
MGRPDSKKNEIVTDIQVKIKMWVTGPENFTVGPGDFKLMQALHISSNLTKAAKSCGYSYKYAWQKLRNITKQSGKAIVETKKGGYGGGGEVSLTEWGIQLMDIYDKAENQLFSVLTDYNKTINKNKKE